MKETTLDKALKFANRAHGDQTYDTYPYMKHINHVVNTASDMMFPEYIRVACALHDVIEDTDFNYQDIKEYFGETVAEIVYCVTDELGRNRQERKAKTYPKIKENRDAVVVKLCDRYANIEHSLNYPNPSKIRMYKSEMGEMTDLARAWMNDDMVMAIWKELHELTNKLQ